jgi:DNA repair exonuclease SbcCD nuclease subunit
MSKIISVIFSDLHIHNYNQFNENNRRLLLKFEIMRQLLKYKVPLLFGGDMFHEDQQITNTVMHHCSRELPKIFKPEYPLVGISGNHDMSEASYIGNETPSLFNSFCNLVPGMISIDFSHYRLTDKVTVWGLPYISYNRGFREYINELPKMPLFTQSKRNILLVHTDLHGARDTDGRKIGSVENIDIDMGKFFNKFDLVFSGHIHKPQRLTKRVIMIGAPDQQRKSDMGGKFGYWLLYDDMKYEHHSLNMPEFREYDPAKDEIDDYHYWVPINSEKEEDLAYEEKKFTNNVSRTLLAKRYCKEKGIKDKKKIEALKEALND